MDASNFVVNPVAFRLFGKDVYWYGIIMALAILAGILLAMRLCKRKGLDPDLVLDMVLVVVPLALVFARIHYVIWSWSEFAGRPFWHVFAVWEGGLAIYGSMIGGLLGLIIFSRWKKIPLLKLCDILVPCLALGQAIGRWGNFCNQELFGPVLTNPSMHFFPLAVYIERTQSYHLGLFFIESVLNLAICLFLYWYVTRKTKRTGTAFALYLLFYGVVRGVLEGLRQPEYIQTTAGLPVNQIFSFVIAALAIVALIVLSRRQEAEQPEVDLTLVEGEEPGSDSDDATPEPEPDQAQPAEEQEAVEASKAQASDEPEQGPQSAQCPTEAEAQVDSRSEPAHEAAEPEQKPEGQDSPAEEQPSKVKGGEQPPASKA
jgi:phosphatidylglycerol:prolipoprotein diacylglycerol transferase